MSEQQYSQQGAAQEWAETEGKTPMKEIFAALAKAQIEFEAALKDGTNPAFRSKYASLDACISAVRQPLNKNGIFLTQTVESVESGVLIETIFAHQSGETYTGGKLFIPVMKHDAQGYGSAITYGRRYSLLAACGVAPEDDDDGDAAVKNKPGAKSKSDQDGVIPRADRRAMWLSDQFAAIDSATTAGELKRIVADALSVAAAENDADAIDQINAHAKAKFGTAKVTK